MTTTIAAAPTATPPATPPGACTPLEGALRIPVALIEPSPLNPRKRWDDAKVAAMAADLKANGQIQPVRVRHNPRTTGADGRPPYEIVVGETRWRAAPGAGLATLDAIVADCTDHQLIQLALAENTRRQDLHPLEEADAFDALLCRPHGSGSLQGYPSVQELAAGVGVSPSYVYQRLKLRALCRAGREAFLAGTIDASVALLIARMPDQAEQARATARIVAGFGGDAYSYRQAAEYLKREFMLQLGLARFNVAAAYKVAGPCAECSKRSGAAPDLFADVTGGDMCQDARCFKAKEEEAHQLLLAEARAAGRTVLQGSAARVVLREPGAKPVGHYRLDAPCPDLTDSARPLSALLGQGFSGSIVMVELPGHALVELVPEAVARKAIKARGLLRQQTSAGTTAPKTVSPAAKASSAAQPPEPATRPSTTGERASKGAGDGQAQRPTPEPRRMTEDEWLRAQARIALELLPVLLGNNLAERMAKAPQLHVAGLVAACRALFEPLSAEACDLVWSAMGWRAHMSARDLVTHYSVLLDERLGQMAADTQRGGRRLGELLTLLAVAEDLTADEGGAPGDVRTPAGKVLASYGVDVGEHLRAAKIMAAARLPPRGKAAGADGAAATDAFVAAHKPAEPGDEVTDEPEARGTAGDDAWTFPKDHY